ncbi:MAG: protein kinase [archaeon]|nr:protein kinase [archaeon]
MEYNSEQPFIEEERTSTFKRKKKQTNSQLKIEGTFLDSYEPSSEFLPENFEILNNKVLGQGAFSTVKLCKNKKNKNLYAVKIISKSILKDNGVDFENVFTEINLQERLNHPNIVRLYSFSEDEDSFYLFMEFVEGKTLYSKVKGGISEREANKYFRQIVSAMLLLHNNKLIHRDIKLENFLLTKDESQVKLCDFGWCVQLTKEEPLRTTICGTYDYMSPEMINEEAYDGSIDIWALGVLLFEILHGYSPFGTNGDDYATTFKNVATHNYKIVKEVTNSCRDLITKLLTFEKNERITINDVYNHPWMNDWKTEPTVKNVPDIKPTSDDTLYDDVLNNVEKMNQGGKKKKKKKKGQKKVTYKKNAKSIKGLGEDNSGEEDEKNEEEIPKLVEEEIKKEINNDFNTFEIEPNVKPKEEKKKEFKEIEIKPKEEKKNTFDHSAYEKPKKIIEEEEIFKPKPKEENKSYLNQQKLKEKAAEKRKVNELIKRKAEGMEEEYGTDKLLSILDLEEKKQIKKEREIAKEIKAYEDDGEMGEFEIKRHKDPIDYNDYKNLEDNLYEFSYENQKYEQKNNDLYDAINIFEKAQCLNKTGKNVSKEKKEKGFWDTIFDNFRCGSSDK